ncbi:hypothetical protein TRIP_C90273 [Candidatus Zixiibacteriota bacterium]|nr:hypothetical protein TRIP_C90273 [candidate division Zixibacteria bacterium]
MVDLKERHIGLNVVGDKILIAANRSGGGLMVVDTLDDLKHLSHKGAFKNESGTLHFGVSEKEAVIKRVRIPASTNLDREKLILFEFLASLPGKEENYYLETHNLNGCPECLAVAYRRENIQRQIEECKSRLFAPSGFRLRSLAMASAFKHFSIPMGGDMICLLDISGDDITFCILDRGLPAAIGQLSNDYVCLEKEIYNTRGLLVDLAAILQYHLSLLFTGGHSAPLSLVILSGTEANADLAAIIGEKLKIKTLLPEFRSELLAGDLIPSAHQYFINLGLTVGF